MNIKETVKKYIEENGNAHILIHSDLLLGFNIKLENRSQFVNEHYNELKKLCQPLDILMPSFNYDFCKGKPYNIETDRSQVGVLSEYFRRYEAAWRSSTPVFNFCGTGERLGSEINTKTDPFDEKSIFGFLDKNRALLMHYGSELHSTTLLHYVERISGKLLYRYDKIFDGVVIDKSNKQYKTQLIYHVIPKGYSFAYDWIKIEKDLIESKIINKYIDGKTQIILTRIDKLVRFWLKKLNNDPFYLLDSETTKWVKEKHKDYNRQFLITDFE